MKSRWVLTAAMLLPILGCGKSPDPWEGTTKPRVLASTVPLFCFAANVAGPDAEVLCLMAAKGPHEFQPSPHDAKLLAGADLFIVNGMNLENFLERLARSSGNARLKGHGLLEMGKVLPPDRWIQVPAVKHGDHWHPAGADPHIWLGIEEAKLQVEAIRDRLCQIDPSHAVGYRDRAAAYLGQLEELKTSAADLRGFKGGIVTFHDSFRYFGRSFGIPIVGSIRGLEGEELSPAQLQEQANEFRAKGVRVIGIEPQYPRRVAESLARTIGGGIKIVELDPLETGPLVEGKSYVVDKDWYVRRMRENIQNLRQALP